MTRRMSISEGGLGPGSQTERQFVRGRETFRPPGSDNGGTSALDMIGAQQQDDKEINLP